MKNVSFILFSLVVLLSCHTRVRSQSKPEVKLSSMTQKENTIRFNFTSSAPFIVGNNYYVLYIGNKGFDKSEMKQVEGSETLSVLLTQDEFLQLTEGAPMYLTYGAIDPEENDLELLSGKTKICWSLGTFTSQLLK